MGDGCRISMGMGKTESQIERAGKMGNYQHWVGGGVQENQEDRGIEMQWRRVYSKLNEIADMEGA